MIFGRKNFFFTRTSCFLAIEFPFVVKKPGSYRMTSRLPAWAGGRIMNLSVSVRLPCLPACRRLRKLQVYLRCLQVYLPACTCVVCKCTWQFQVAISGSGLLSSRHRPESLAGGLFGRPGCNPCPKRFCPTKNQRAEKVTPPDRPGVRHSTRRREPRCFYQCSRGGRSRPGRRPAHSGGF